MHTGNHLKTHLFRKCTMIYNTSKNDSYHNNEHKILLNKTRRFYREKKKNKKQTQNWNSNLQAERKNSSDNFRIQFDDLHFDDAFLFLSLVINNSSQGRARESHIQRPCPSFGERAICANHGKSLLWLVQDWNIASWNTHFNLVGFILGKLKRENRKQREYYMNDAVTTNNWRHELLKK